MARRLRIVVVEDDASMRHSIGRLLRASGFECVEYDSAEALLQSEDPQDWDCLVTDMHLPGMSGLDLVEKLRLQHPAMPAVFITAYDEAKRRERALGCHRAAYLTKPFEGTALPEVIRKVTLSCR